MHEHFNLPQKPTYTISVRLKYIFRKKNNVFNHFRLECLDEMLQQNCSFYGLMSNQKVKVQKNKNKSEKHQNYRKLKSFNEKKAFSIKLFFTDDTLNSSLKKKKQITEKIQHNIYIFR